MDSSDRGRQITLQKIVDEREMVIITESSANERGNWSYGGTWPGKYTIHVTDADGNRWAERAIKVSDDSELFIGIEDVREARDSRFGIRGGSR